MQPVGINLLAKSATARYFASGIETFMEKNSPHVRLTVVKALIRAGKAKMTKAALSGAAAMGLNEVDVLDVTSNLQPSDFYKSMTSYHDHRQWQDVYCPRTAAGEIYLKLIVVDDVLVVSFKESTS